MQKQTFLCIFILCKETRGRHARPAGRCIASIGSVHGRARRSSHAHAPRGGAGRATHIQPGAREPAIAAFVVALALLSIASWALINLCALVFIRDSVECNV
ncbi:hypothetical protein EVAR_93044_1 [Eumeta japonica]|uniref:Uncharacterized protein n=1 Tax=Eumeta variegata TaxID=151549 RepID=A0A4C1TI16_EUMVA|nr:hypothetical protein EVAR_93044_1 [Eumeta japonica]